MATKTVSTLKSRKQADALILPFFEGNKPAFSGKDVRRHYEKILKVGDFKGKK